MGLTPAAAIQSGRFDPAKDGNSSVGRAESACGEAAMNAFYESVC